MNDSKAGAVSLRERVSSSPAQSLVESYYMHGIAAGLRFQYQPEIRIHLAHAVMLEEQGIVSDADIGAIVGVLLRLRSEGPELLEIDYRQEDLYSYIERFIVSELGPETGGRLHTGRSRNDLHTTSWRMALRSRLLNLLEAVLDLRSTMLRLAGDHVNSVMPGYTHTQHAQPITLGYYLVSAADLVGRDFRRLAAALRCADRCPLGSGALSTTGFPISRETTRDLLGFADLVEVAYDGVSSRDDVHEAAAALAVMMTGLSRVGTDLQLWNTMEFGFIEFDDTYSSVSSIMPQKKNPAAMEHLKAVAAMATGALSTVLATGKNTSFADVNDGVTALNVPCLDAMERATQAIVVLEGALSTLKVRTETMLRAATIGYGTATELADVIVRETGMSFRMAHNIVGWVVREAIAAGRTADEITSEDIDTASEALFSRRLGLSAAAVSEALDPAANVRSRRITGGPAPERMREMLAARAEALAADRDTIGAVRDRLTAADAALDARVERLSSASQQAGGADGTR